MYVSRSWHRISAVSFDTAVCLALRISNPARVTIMDWPRCPGLPNTLYDGFIASLCTRIPTLFRARRNLLPYVLHLNCLLLETNSFHPQGHTWTNKWVYDMLIFNVIRSAGHITKYKPTFTALRLGFPIPHQEMQLDSFVQCLCKQLPPAANDGSFTTKPVNVNYATCLSYNILPLFKTWS